MKTDPTIYAYRMAENVVLKDSPSNGDILTSKTAQIQLQDQVKIAVIFIRMPLDDFASISKELGSALHSQEKTQAHFREMLLARGNSKKKIDTMLRKIQDEYKKIDPFMNELVQGKKHFTNSNHTPEKTTLEINDPVGRQEQFTDSNHTLARTTSEKNSKFLISPNKNNLHEPIPIVANYFEIVNTDAIINGKVLRVNDEDIVYKYISKKTPGYQPRSINPQRDIQEKPGEKNYTTVVQQSESKPLSKPSPTTPQSRPLPEGSADGKRRIELPDISNRPTLPTLPSRTDRPNLTNRLQGDE